MRHCNPFALSLLLCLCACNTTPAGWKPLEVDVKVPIPCAHQLPTEPVWQLTITQPDADIVDQTKAALIEINQHLDYEDDLRTELLNCR